MPIPFERFENIATHKVVTVGPDGFLRQHGFDPKNMNQHWLRTHQFNPQDGTFKIRCRASDRVIDAQGGHLIDHAVLQQFPDSGDPNQRWKIVASDEDPNVFFIHAANTNEVWSVVNGSTADDAQIELLTQNGANHQRWRIKMTEMIDHAFTIKSMASNLVLDVPGFSQADGTSIQQFQENLGFNQLWHFVPLSDGRQKIRSVCSGKLLDYPLGPAQHNQGATVSQYDDNGGANQTWKIVAPGGSIPANITSGTVVNIKSGFSASNGLFLDVPNGSAAAGTLIQTFGGNGSGANEKWLLTEFAP